MTDYKNIAYRWTQEPYDLETKNEVQKLIDSNDENALKERFYAGLEFGTGGIRGEMGFGTSRINIYTISMATQGLSDYLLSQTDNPCVVIAFDSRNNSRLFAEKTAQVLGGNNIKCYMFNDIAPTPLMSFAVRQLKATAGVNITASHNPKEYNGYKVFYSDGGQVLPPHDTGIIKKVEQITDIKQVKSISISEMKKLELYHDIPQNIIDNFFKTIENITLAKDEIKKTGDKLKIVYTPLHGTGLKYVTAILKKIGFNNVYLVNEQADANGDFPTIKVPNPEERESLSLAIKLGQKENAHLVIATDPDCDRVGIAVNINNNFELLNGNETGVIIAHYMLKTLTDKKKLPKNPFVVKTIVTTDSINRIAEKFGVEVIDVLTGFKYIGEQIELNRDKSFIMGFEESYGYLTGDFIRDKCGVCASAMIAEISLYCLNNNMTLLDYLDNIYSEFGFRKEFLKSFTIKGIEGSQKIKTIMENLRTNPPKEINTHKVTAIRDVLNSTLKKDNNIIKLNLPKSNVLTFYLDDKTTITARPSGTEPKIKFYFSVCAEKTDNETILEVKNRLIKKGEELINTVTEWIN